jgi:hypothetical protein
MNRQDEFKVQGSKFKVGERYSEAMCYACKAHRNVAAGFSLRQLKLAGAKEVAGAEASRIGVLINGDSGIRLAWTLPKNHPKPKTQNQKPV